MSTWRDQMQKLDDLASEYGGRDTGHSTWAFEGQKDARAFKRAAKKLRFVVDVDISNPDDVDVELKESVTGPINDLLEELHELTLDEASKAALKRRLQSYSGGTEGHFAQMRYKKAQQAARLKQRHAPAARSKRRKREKQYRDVALQQKRRSAVSRLRGAAMAAPRG